MTDTAEPQTQPSQQNAQAQQPQQSSQQSKHMMTPREKKWIVYDVGNSAFVLLSTAVVPIYANSLLKAAGETNIVSTWGYAQTIASLVIAVLMPLLGSIADVQGMKIRFFTGFFLTGVVMCCAMAMPLGWLAFIIVYVLATIGLNGSLTFYDSMLVDTTSNERMDRISSHGYAWGYIGSTVPFIVCIALIFGGPALFGWSTTACTRASFVITALWWVAFTIPLLTSYKQVHYRATAGQAGEAIRGTFAELGSTFRAIRKNKPLWMFMIAFFFYIDAVNTVISMSTSYGTQLGIDSTQLVVALLVNVVIRPYNNRQKIINMMNEIQKMFLPLLQSRVLEHRYPDLTPLTERMTSLASELRIFEKQPVALWQHAVRVAARRQEAAYLRGCEQLLAKMCGELAALCNMDSNPAPGEKSIERLTAHGLTAPENLKDYCRCSPVDAQVMDFHIGNLLDAYDFLTAFHHV